MCKYCTECCVNNVQNIVWILFKFYENIYKNWEYIRKILYKNCADILQTMYKYCKYTVQIIYKHCTNIEHILWNYCANTVICQLYIAQLLFKYQPNFEPILCKNKYKNHANIEQISWKYC